MSQSNLTVRKSAKTFKEILRCSKWCVLASILSAVLALSCDSTVHIQFFQSMLSDIVEAGHAYNRHDGQTCGHHARLFDLDVVIRVTSMDEVENEARVELAKPGDLLTRCVLAMGEPSGDDDDKCYLSSESVQFNQNTRVQFLSDEDGELLCEDDDDCVGFPGDRQWECNTLHKRCETRFSLNARQGSQANPNPMFIPNGDVTKPKIVALVLDHSESLSGIDATDQNLNRIAANIVFTKKLNFPQDRAAVYSFNQVGVESVRNLTLAHGGQTGFISDRSQVERSLNDLASGAQGGCDVWDAIVRAAQDLRQEDLEARNPSIVLFTDGVESESISTYESAKQALLAQEPPIPLFVVHLENHNVLGGEAPEGRMPDLERLTCASNGAYFYASRPQQLASVYQEVLPDLTVGRWRLQTSYESLGTSDFPIGRYAIRSSLTINLDGIAKNVDLGLGYGLPTDPTQARTNPTIYVEKLP